MYFFKTYFKIFSFSVNVLGRISEKNILAESAFHSQLVCNCTCVCVFNKYGNIVYSINKGKRQFRCFAKQELCNRIEILLFFIYFGKLARNFSATNEKEQLQIYLFFFL